MSDSPKVFSATAEVTYAVREVTCYQVVRTRNESSPLAGAFDLGTTVCVCASRASAEQIAAALAEKVEW